MQSLIVSDLILPAELSDSRRPLARSERGARSHACAWRSAVD